MTKTTSDNNKLPENMKKACCNICTLSDKMKDCPRCPFVAYSELAKKFQFLQSITKSA